MTSRLPPLLLCVLTLGLACGKGRSGSGEVVAADGSSTVYPITEAVAEEFQKKGDARVTIGVSGTGGGFKKFCKGEIALSGASRPIKQSEVEQCKQGGVEYVELPVAYDGIAVVVHPDNDWVTQLTVEDLKKIWEPAAQGKVMRWSDVRPEWPAEELHLFGPGVDSGTYDYFTKAVVGEEHASRGDFTSSEDDNVLVQGVSGDKNALGFFGFAYYSENAGKLKVVPIDDGDAKNGASAITPTVETIADGTYQPLSRPIFIYVSKGDAARPAVEKFVQFYLSDGPKLVSEVGYVPLPPATYELVRQRFSDRTTGSVFGGEGSKVGATVAETLQHG